MICADPLVPARVAFVGAGPGDAGLMTVRSQEYLQAADAVIHDEGGAHLAAEFVREGVPLRLAPRAHGRLSLVQASNARLLDEVARAHPGGLIVRLMSGDPAVFNSLAEEAAACVRAGIPFEVVPGVAAATAIPAYAGVPLTVGSTEGLLVLTTGGHEPGTAADETSTVVTHGEPDHVQETLDGLLHAGRPGWSTVALTSAGTTVHQATLTTTLAEAEGVLARFEGQVLAIVGPTVAMRDQLSWFETRPLFGWTVLVPRTKEQSSGMTHRLACYGAESTVVPTISVEPPRTPQPMERALRGLIEGRYEWVGFTSVNAVRAVRDKFEEHGIDVRALAGVRVAAVGGVTAAALKDWGIRADLVPEGEQSARGLLEDWPEYDPATDPIDRVFLPRADIATDTLVAGLKDLGWEVDDVTAYRTVRAAPPPAEVREAIKSGSFDAVVFTSSSTVRNLIGIAGKPHANTIVACIGPATAKTAEEFGLRVDVLAAEPSAAAVIDALADHGRSLALAASEAGIEWRRPSQRRPPGRRRMR